MRIIIGFILLLVPVLAQSQGTYNLPPKSFYKSANVTLKDFSKYECKNVYIQSDSIFLRISTLASTKVWLYPTLTT